MPEMKCLKFMIKDFDTIHVQEISTLKTDSFPEIRKKVISIFKIPEKTRVHIKELMRAQQKPEESV